VFTLRDFGLSTALDSSIRQAFLLATELLLALRGEWRLDFHSGKQYQSCLVPRPSMRFYVRAPSLAHGHLQFIRLRQGRVYRRPLSIWYKGESDLGYEMVYIHAEELDWPYRLSHAITTHHYGEDNMLVLVSFLLAHSSGPLLALQVS
jgi:hypothetical protein